MPLATWSFFGALSGSMDSKAAPVSISWDSSAVTIDFRFAADHWISASMAAETTTEHPDDPTIADECWVATICIDGTGEYPASEGVAFKLALKASE